MHRPVASAQSHKDYVHAWRRIKTQRREWTAVAPCWCRRLPNGFFLSVPVCKMRCARKLLRRLRDSFPRRSIAEQRRAMHAAHGQWGRGRRLA
jgi:hypothetical protein